MSVVIQLSTRSFWSAPLSPLIRFVTWSEYSHADFVMPNNQLLGALMFKGVTVHEPAANYSRCDRFEMKGAPDSVYQRALTQVGKGYDWTADFGVFLHRDWDATDSWQCSEFVTWAFYQEGFRPIATEHLNRVTPGQLRLSPFLAQIS